MTTNSREAVGPEVILKGVGGKDTHQVELTGTQVVGVRLAIGVGAAIVLVMLFALVDWYRMGNSMFSSIPDAAHSSEQLLSHAKGVSELANERLTKVFDLIVVKALLPIFTGVLGYVFGERKPAKPA